MKYNKISSFRKAAPLGNSLVPDFRKPALLVNSWWFILNFILFGSSNVSIKCESTNSDAGKIAFSTFIYFSFLPVYNLSKNITTYYQSKNKACQNAPTILNSFREFTLWINPFVSSFNASLLIHCIPRTSLRK